MSKRPSERLIKRKRILDIIKEGPKTTSQILNLTKKIKYPRATVIRILHEFETLKLIKKIEGFWYWCEYHREFANIKEYEIMLEHSKGLIPGLQAILTSIFGLEEKHDEKSIKLKEYAEQHLITGYPTVYSKIREFRKANQESKERIAKYLASLQDKLCFIITSLKPIEIKPLYPGMFAMTYAASPIIEAKTKEEALEFRKILDSITKEEESKLLRIYKDLSGEVCAIILKVEHGTPLKGKCDACPQIKMKEI